MTAKTARIPGRITTALLALALVGGASMATAPPTAASGFEGGVCALSLGTNGNSYGRILDLRVKYCTSITPVLVVITGPNGWSRTLVNAMIAWGDNAYDGPVEVPTAGTYTVTASGDDGDSLPGDSSSISQTLNASGSTPKPTPSPTPKPSPTPVVSPRPTVSPTPSGSPPVAGLVTPTVVRHPAATSVSRTANLIIRFNTRVRGVSASTIRLRDRTSGTWVTATVRLSSDGRTATLNPSRTLAGRHRYGLSLSAVINSGPGRHLAARTYAFVTRS